jgi:hypothetical protein
LFTRLSRRFLIQAPREHQRKIDPLTAVLAYVALKGGQVAGYIPMSMLVGKGSLPQDAEALEKAERGKEHAKLRRFFTREHETSPEKLRQAPGFHPSSAYAIPHENAIAVSPRASSSILAHELGHVANYTKGQKSIPGKVHQGLTSLSYSPLYPASSIAGTGGYVMADQPGMEHMEGLGHAGTAGAGILGGLQLLEEARASMKARKALKAVRGDQYSEKEMLPLAGGLGTYALGAGSAVGFPLLLHHYLSG